jgi:hypothetical protein
VRRTYRRTFSVRPSALVRFCKLAIVVSYVSKSQWREEGGGRGEREERGGRGRKGKRLTFYQNQVASVKVWHDVFTVLAEVEYGEPVCFGSDGI